jgi:hypothetical protein
VTYKKIPSEEDFQRASLALKKRSQGLSEVRDIMLLCFKESDDMHDFFILDSSDILFRAYVFYRWDRQIQEAKESGLAEKIMAATYDALKTVAGRYNPATQIEFEFDSHENVERQYAGDYFDRLR